MIIGLTGSISAGKQEVTNHLLEKGFDYLSLSKEVRRIARLSNIDINDEEGRRRLQDLGNRLRQERGIGYLAELVVERIRDQEYGRTIVDGVRNPGEVQVLRKLEDFYLISIDAPRKSRFEWLKGRDRPSDPKTWEEFVKVDDRDKGIGESDLGQAVGKCMELANYAIWNDGSKEELKKKVEIIYKEIYEKVSP